MHEQNDCNANGDVYVTSAAFEEEDSPFFSFLHLTASFSAVLALLN